MRTTRYFALVAVAVFVIGCASNPKAKAVTAYQGVEIGLGALQDAERTAYAAGTIPALTKELHETKISPAFVKAFDMQIRVGNALLVWKPGTALPAGFDQWVASIENLADVLKTVSPRNSAVFDATVSMIRAAVDAIQRFGQTPPPALVAVAKSTP